MHPELIPELHAALRQLLPSEVALSIGPVADGASPLLGDEVAAAARMVDKRRQEFCAGRTHARLVLAKLGLPPVALPVGTDRAPVWPAGVVGSISHAADIVMAVAASTQALAGIGIDLEPATPLDDELLSRVCRPEELMQLRNQSTPMTETGVGHLAKLIFSAKESVYKCVAPRMAIFLEFADVEILLNRSGLEFSARGHGPAQGHIRPDCLSGRFTDCTGYWLTAAWQRA